MVARRPGDVHAGATLGDGQGKLGSPRRSELQIGVGVAQNPLLPQAKGGDPRAPATPGCLHRVSPR